MLIAAANRSLPWFAAPAPPRIHRSRMLSALFPNRRAENPTPGRPSPAQSIRSLFCCNARDDDARQFARPSLSLRSVVSTRQPVQRAPVRGQAELELTRFSQILSLPQIAQHILMSVEPKASPRIAKASGGFPTT